jgi:hypothetical protein
VTAYFNPGDSSIQRRNYQRFRRRLKSQGVPLLTVELGFGDRPFDLGPDEADKRIQIRGGDVLWQKERLLNLGVQALPSDCDRVAWLDCDVLFDRDDWADETGRLLESYVVVQPFLRRVRLPQDQTDADPDALPVGMAEAHVHYGVAYGVAAKGLGSLNAYRRHGSTGFAWAARRALLDRHGLYDRLVLGGADKMMARAMYRGFDGVATKGFSPALVQHVSTWADAFFADVRGSVGYADATVLHLWRRSPDLVRPQPGAGGVGAGVLQPAGASGHRHQVNGPGRGRTEPPGLTLRVAFRAIEDRDRVEQFRSRHFFGGHR